VLSVALWGMPLDTTCGKWDGWGDVPAVPIVATPPEYARVIEPPALVLNAPGSPPQRPVLEPFTPTAFTPRVTCVAPFGNETQYLLSVWVNTTRKNKMRWCVGIGRKERSVYSLTAILGASFTAGWLHAWNHWSPWLVRMPLWFPALIALVNPPAILTTPAPPSRKALQIIAISASLQSVVAVIVLTWSTAVSSYVDLLTWLGSLAINSVAPLYIARVIYKTCTEPLTKRAGRWLVLYGVIHGLLGIGYAVGPVTVIILGGYHSIRPEPVVEL